MNLFGECGILWWQQRAISESFPRENLFSTNLWISFLPQNFPAIRYILSSVYKSFDEHIHRHTRWRMFQQWQFCVEIKGCSFACFHRVIVFKAPAYRWTSLEGGVHMGFTLRSYQARMSPALNRNSAVRSSNMTMQLKYHNLQFLHGTAIYVSEKRLAWRG